MKIYPWRKGCGEEVSGEGNDSQTHVEGEDDGDQNETKKPDELPTDPKSRVFNHKLFGAIQYFHVHNASYIQLTNNCLCVFF